MNTPTIKKFQQFDTQDFINNLEGLAVVAKITYESATQTIGTVPANSIIGTRYIVRTTKWDAITTFEVGKSGDTDWLATTTQTNVDGAIDSGEDGNVEAITGNKVVTSNTDIIVTLDQGAAAQGVGYVVVPYKELVR